MQIDWTAIKQVNLQATTMDDDVDCASSILNQLILLTEQYKRLMELLENKRNMLKQRALELHKRRLEQKLEINQMCLNFYQSPTNEPDMATINGESMITQFNND